MEERQLEGILCRLDSGSADEAWEEFLEGFSPHVLQVIRLFEREPDPVGDCFLFVCQQLRAKGFRRLRRFRAEGPARFSTWLRAVVRNLCLDWHRRECGRQRVFKAVQALGALETAVFRCRFREGLRTQEALLTLRAPFPQLTEPELIAAEERIRKCLTPRQLWLLSLTPPRAVPLPLEDPDGHEGHLRDPHPSPEEQLSLTEQRAALARALSRLKASERLLVRLRFEEDLTLEEVARVTGLGNAQQAERRIREVLERLQKAIGGEA